MRIDRASEQTTKDDCSFGTKTGPVGLPLNCTAYGQLHHLLEEPVVPVLSTYLNLKERKKTLVREFVQFTFPNLLCPKRRWIRLFLSH